MPAPARPTVANPFHPWILGAITALFVARPLTGTDVPSISPWHFWHSELGTPPGLRQGLLPVVLWLVVAAVWCMGHLSSDRRWRTRPADWAMALLLLFHSASALWAVGHAAPRPAWNTLWIWLGLGAAYFLVRCAVSSAREVRGLIAALLALALPLAGYGLYQHFIELPETRARFEQDRERLLREAGLSSVIADPAARQAYENRVQSQEPFGTFALTNSLAGFLAPWFVVLVGLAVRRATERSHGSDQLPPWWLATGLLLLAACLLVTKSRSAWIGSAAGVGLLLLGVAARRWGPGLLRGLAAAALGLAVLVGLGVWTGSLDAKVLSESNKSLRYRFEYWHGAWQIVREHPWAGCGPGNFRDAYTRHKLPEASEEIADPHNLFVEVWATAGTPALMAFVGLFGCVAWSLLGAPPSGSNPSEPQSPQPSATKNPAESSESDPTLAISLGAVGGLLLAWFLTLAINLPLAEWMLIPALAAVPVTMFALRPWILAGSEASSRDDAWLAACGAAALTVNLLAAGGISYPGVSDSLWLLLALVASSLAGWTVPSHREPIARGKTWASLIGVLALVGACAWTAYLPAARQALSLRQASLSPAPEPLLEEAQQADPLADTPPMALAEFYFERWKALGDEADFQRFEQFKDRGLALRPESFTNWQDVSNWYHRANQHRPDPRWARAAAEHSARAAALYPNSPAAHAHWALAELAQATPEGAAAARREAAEALRLDGLTEHLDKKLRSDQRQTMQRIAAGK